MGGLRVVMIIVVLLALIFNVAGDSDKRLHARNAKGQGPQMPCTNDPSDPFHPPCSSSPPPPLASTTTTVIEDDSNVSDATVLERAHWCRFSNGTYVPLGQTFMHTVCSMCQCTTSRAIRCQTLQCLPTYCIDNSMPYRKDGQCCAQCGYEVARNSCVYNGISFPHGVVMKSVENKMQCWCQLGNIECRDYIGSLFDSMDMMTDGRVIYIIIIVLCVVLIFGLLICFGCTFFFYYYYKRNQHTFQQAYDQYINSAGWQPMNEEEQNEVDATATAAEEKQFEAESYQPPEYANEMVPPPYAPQNGSYVHDEHQKRM